LPSVDFDGRLEVGPVGEAANNGTGEGLGSRVDGVLRNIRIGGGLVGAAVTIGFFTKEVQRILGLPPMLQNDLYLVLLLLVFLLAGSWFLCALMHVEQMQKWTDPVNYQPPEEVIRIVAFAAVFIGMIYAARGALSFGIVYLIYVVMNLFTLRHLRAETAEVIRKTREGWGEETESKNIHRDAVAALEAYFARLLGTGRAFWVLLGAVCGLLAAAAGAATRSGVATNVAYIIFIVSVGVPELVLSWRWRAILANRLRPCEAALFELKRHSGASGQ
jgi:hypothetical protein